MMRSLAIVGAVLLVGVTGATAENQPEASEVHREAIVDVGIDQSPASPEQPSPAPCTVATTPAEPSTVSGAERESLPGESLISFADGFESGGLMAWQSTCETTFTVPVNLTGRW